MWSFQAVGAFVFYFFHWQEDEDDSYLDSEWANPKVGHCPLFHFAVVDLV